MNTATASPVGLIGPATAGMGYRFFLVAGVFPYLPGVAEQQEVIGSGGT